MYLTQQTDYAMRVLIYAAVNDGVLVNIGTIAEAYKISKSHFDESCYRLGQRRLFD